MVVVGSSFGSSGIFRCFRARFAGHADLFVRPVARCDFVFGWVLSVIGMEELAGQAARAVRAAATLPYLRTTRCARPARLCNSAAHLMLSVQ